VLQIETLQSSVQSKENKSLKLEEKIQKTKVCQYRIILFSRNARTVNQASWFPALTNLVTAIGEKFSAAFDRKISFVYIYIIS